MAETLQPANAIRGGGGFATHPEDRYGKPRLGRGSDSSLSSRIGEGNCVDNTEALHSRRAGTFLGRTIPFLSKRRSGFKSGEDPSTEETDVSSEGDCGKDGRKEQPAPFTIFISCSKLIRETKLCVGEDLQPALDAVYTALQAKEIGAESAVKCAVTPGLARHALQAACGACTMLAMLAIHCTRPMLAIHCAFSLVMRPRLAPPRAALPPPAYAALAGGYAAVRRLVQIVGSTIVQQAGLSVNNAQQGFLPHGWLKYVDEVSDRPYYYNVRARAPRGGVMAMGYLWTPGPEAAGLHLRETPGGNGLFSKGSCELASDKSPESRRGGAGEGIHRCASQ